jgi:23S rRNA pseudouridine1911/1915/1917 synthase
MHNNKIILSILTENETVEEFLKNTFNLSRNQIKKSKLSKPFLNKKLRYKDETSFPIDIVNKHCINPCYKGDEVKLISESDDTLVLSKPSRCHIHPLSYDEQDNILSYIRSSGKWPSFLEVNTENYDRSLLFRLDYETSGLVILSKGKLQRSDVKSKIYLAAVEGHIDDELELIHNITTQGKTVKVSDTGEHSKCHVKKLAYNKDKNISIVLVKLSEGRRHQIRVQLSATGHPIVGDSLYNSKLELGYFGLHCLSYSFSEEKFWDLNIPFTSLLNSFLDINCDLQVLCDEFRVAKS